MQLNKVCDKKMKKSLEIAIDLIKNSIRYKTKQIDYTLDSDSATITVFDTKYEHFNATGLIGAISAVDSLNCYLVYNKEMEKVILRIF